MLSTSTIILLAVLVAIVVLLIVFRKPVVSYCKESYDELVHKVTWPTLKELSTTAVIVLVASFIIAIVVFGVNELFSLITDFIYGLV